MKETLNQKLGPLPLWTWGLMGGLAVVVWVWVSASEKESAALVPMPSDEYLVNRPASSDSLDGAFSARNGSSESSYYDNAPVAETNESWIASVTNILSGKGSWSPLQIQAALQKYVSGNPLSDAEQEIVNSAITEKGVAPDATSVPALGSDDWVRFYRDARGKFYGVLYNGSVRSLTDSAYAALGRPSLSSDDYISPTTPAPAPAPAPVPAPAPAPAPAQRQYVVNRGDSLWSIAQRHYGNPLKWRAIYDANRASIRNPNIIYPGQTLVIPA